jgi:hypothetical protein
MIVSGNDLTQYNALKILTVQEYLILLTQKMKEKPKEDGR